MNKNKQPIGIFDSGIGGLTILKELVKELPNEDFVYFGDNKNAPYGPRSADEILNFSKKIMDFLMSKNSKAVVVACNTATAAAINELRANYQIPIIGIEPAVKPACLFTKTNNIGVIATEGTFKGQHFISAIEKYKNYVKIFSQVGKELVEFAEKGIFSGQEVEKVIQSYFEEFAKYNVDYVVLGCTHFAFFYKVFFKISNGKFAIIDSAEPVSRRTKDILMINNIKEIEPSNQKLSFYTSGNTDFFRKILIDFLEIEVGEIGEIEN
ncbi:MAG: glutamate racemase [Bacteroidales bacterium]|jgi:glutamate racemase|nr:glutamate racemase [Bacteroidales bacterium]